MPRQDKTAAMSLISTAACESNPQEHSNHSQTRSNRNLSSSEIRNQTAFLAPSRPSILSCKFYSAIATAFAIAIASVLPSGERAFAAEPQTATWQTLLERHVKISGGVSYMGFKKDAGMLDSFLNSHAKIDPRKMSDDKKKAVYINLYNALMIKNILRYAAKQKIPVAGSKFTQLEINSIKVPGGNIWNGDYKTVLAGHEVNLDNIEHQLIRGVKSDSLKNLKVSSLDPRIHTAVNCAALSCPRVRELAYTEKNVNKLLDQNIKEYMSSSEHFGLASKSKINANSIVLWYYSDFDDYAQKTLQTKGAGTYLSQFIDPRSKDALIKVKILKESFNDRSALSLRISSAFSFHYNWQINDVRNKKG